MFARCEADGTLRAESGRVEIRYNPKDGRAYKAGVRNLSPMGDAVLPDSHCGPAEAAAPSKAAKGGQKSRSSKGAGSVAAPPTVPSGQEALVYADGACTGNPGPCGLGVVMITAEGTRELSEFLGHGTNNIAELTAIQRAAEAMEDPSRPLHIYTDSNYSIGVLTKGWKAKANQALIVDVKAALKRVKDVRLFHVRGHAGIELNERADRLAVQAVKTRSSAGWQDA